MTRVLFLTPELPYPANQGASIRNLNILLGLSPRYELDLLSQTSSPVSSIPESLQEVCSRAEYIQAPNRTTSRRFFDLITKVEPDLALRLYSTRFLARLTEILREAVMTEAGNGFYEIVQIEGLELAFSIPAIRTASPESKIVYDAHNYETEIQRMALETDVRSWKRWPGAIYSYLQLLKLRRYEKWVVSEADWTVTVSEPDKQKLQAMNPTAHFTVIPNSIDIQSIRFGRYDTVYNVDLVFVGKMDYRPNVDAVSWFTEEIWPRIRVVYPGTTMAIVGQKPHPKLDFIKGIPGITVTGKVPSVMPYLNGAKIVVAPFRIGSGSRLKIIEAMAAKKAIVSTRIGAQGFDVKSDYHLILSDTADDFAQSVCRLLENPNERDFLGENAGMFADKYDWRQVVPLFEEIYRRLKK